MKTNIEMPFWDHAEELRRRCFYVMGAWCAAAVVCYAFTDWMLQKILDPVGRVIFLYPAEAFIVRLKLACWAGLAVTVPWIFAQTWIFVRQGLQGREYRSVLLWGLVGLAGSGVGVLFGHFLLVPYAVQFLLGFGSSVLQPMITAQQYLEFYLSLVAFSALIFELPLAMVMLTYLGVLDPERVKFYRRHAYVAIFIAAAVLSPPDAVTQILLAVPLCGLYELGLAFSHSVKRHREGL